MKEFEFGSSKNPKYKNRCAQYITAIDQRKTETARGQGFEATESFEEFGCYKCKGKDTTCPLFKLNNPKKK